MKNNLFLILITFCFTKFLYAENLDISAKSISLDKKNEITIFQEEVIIKDEKNNIIKTEYAEYSKKKRIFYS